MSEDNNDYDPMSAGFDTVPSLQTIPSSWSLTVGIGSIGWVTACWYRWYFDDDAGLMLSKTYEWSIRRFWKIYIEP